MLDKKYIEEELKGKNKENLAIAQHIKDTMSFGRRYLVLGLENGCLHVPDNQNNLRLYNRIWFKFKGVVK
jgi:hypothetical protein